MPVAAAMDSEVAEAVVEVPVAAVMVSVALVKVTVAVVMVSVTVAVVTVTVAVALVTVAVVMVAVSVVAVAVVEVVIIVAVAVEVVVVAVAVVVLVLVVNSSLVAVAWITKPSPSKLPVRWPGPDSTVDIEYSRRTVSPVQLMLCATLSKQSARADCVVQQPAFFDAATLTLQQSFSGNVSS